MASKKIGSLLIPASRAHRLPPVTLGAVVAAFLVSVTMANHASGNPPEHPLPAPQYSFDRLSPAAIFMGVEADAVLALSWPHPINEIPGEMLGLGLEGDELDALSSSNATLAPEETFLLMFSVDEFTFGTVPPDEHMIHEGLPYNVQDQAIRGHQSGDQYISTALFDMNGVASDGDFNNVLVRNNYDEGGTDFAALPVASAEDVVPSGAQDGVDATAYLLPGEVYYSPSGDSPSLLSMPAIENPSGAYIIFCSPDMQPLVYASPENLGLVQTDDIDALVVFDTNTDGTFNGDDRVFFSLTPDSPSLAGIEDASETGAAADVYAVAPGQAPWLFVSAESLGLGAPDDNIDALEILFCEDAEHCAEDHSIQGINGESDEEEEEEEHDDDEPDAREDGDRQLGPPPMMVRKQ